MMGFDRPNRSAWSFPGGRWGVAAAAALLGLLIAMIIPMAMIERASWELYLDRLVASARPPLGGTARLVFALLFSSALAGAGWLIATMLRVVPQAGGLFDRWRTQRSDDEDDAPDLRQLDRHPDAPARRPFSAARDVLPEDADAAEFAPLAPADDVDLEDDELLLDAHFDERWTPSVEADAERDERWHELEAVEPEDAAVAPAPLTAPVEEVAPAAEAPAAPAAAPEQPAQQAEAPAPAALDLSIARLDELIARLERGLERKAQAVSAAPANDAVAGTPRSAGDAAPAATDDDASFPQDPALAAALATLRRMNRNV